MRLNIRFLIILSSLFVVNCTPKPEPEPEIDPRPINEIILDLNSHLQYIDSVATYICKFPSSHIGVELDSLMLKLLTPDQKNYLIRCLIEKNVDIINLSRGTLQKEAHKNLNNLTARIDTDKLFMEIGFVRPNCTLCNFQESHFYKLQKTAPNFYKAEFIPESDRWQ